MNLLVIGGCHTYGYGLDGRQSFIDRFTNQCRQQGCSLSVDQYALIDLHQVATLLADLPLRRYDLIFLQLGHYRLQHPPGFASLLTRPTLLPTGASRPVTPLTADDIARLRSHAVVSLQPVRPSVGKRLKTTVKLGLLRSLCATRRLARLNEVNDQLKNLLTLLRHLEPVSQYLRQQGRHLFLAQGRQYGFRVFDTNQVIRPRPAYFLSNDFGHLNAAGHELLGHSLYAFYQAHFVQKTAAELVG